MTSDEHTCPFCNQPVDPDAPTTTRQVSGWANAVIVDKVVEVKPTGAFAHLRCVKAAELAETPPRFVDGGA